MELSCGWMDGGLVDSESHVVGDVMPTSRGVSEKGREGWVRMVSKSIK